MKVKTLVSLFLAIIVCPFVFSQSSTIDDLYIKNIDSLISNQLKLQRQYKNQEPLVFLKDSVIFSYYDDAITPCENQPTVFYYTYDEYGRLIVAESKDTPETGCTSHRRQELISYLSPNLTERVIQVFDFNLGIWENLSKNTLLYDEKDNLIERVFQNWNTTLIQWENASKTIDTYSENLQLGSKSYNWNLLSNNWFWYINEIFTYDSNNNLLEDLYQKWDTSINDWENTRKQTNVYDANENRIQSILHIKYSNETVYEWSRINKDEFSYDTNNFLIEQFGYRNWNNVEGDWDTRDKYSYTNNANGNPLEMHRFLWNETTSIWENSTLINTTYNVNNSVIEKFTQRWDTTINTWKNSQLETTDYNAFNNLIESTFQTWSQSSQTWYTEGMTIKEYDQYQNLIHSRASSDYDLWEFYIYYSEHEIILDVNENLTKNKYSVYPNPSNDVVFIQGLKDTAKIIIYDLNGKKVLETKTQGSIDISNFQEGIYIIKIITNESIAYTKLIKS